LSYTHFTLEERKYLQQLLSEGLSFRKIAVIPERSPSTISREVKRNKAKYRPHGKTTTNIGTITGVLIISISAVAVNRIVPPWNRIPTSGITSLPD